MVVASKPFLLKHQAQDPCPACAIMTLQLKGESSSFRKTLQSMLGKSEVEEAVQTAADMEVRACKEEPQADAWEQALVAETTDASVQEALMESCRGLLAKFGSASKYLQQRYMAKEERQTFVQHLWDLQKLDAAFVEVSRKRLERTRGAETIALPLAAFSLSPNSSVKPDADVAQALQMVELILKQGFQTQSEPLQVTQGAETLEEAENSKVTAPWHEHGELLPLSVGTVKGKTRIHCLLLLLSVVIDNDTEMEAFATLVDSLREVRVQVYVLGSRKEELLHNFQMGVRGAIRKAPSVWTWVSSLLSLGATADADMTAVIKSFNEFAPTSEKLTGGKASAVRMILQRLPQRSIVKIDWHVQMHGWSRCCFSDDALSSKKMTPDFNFRHLWGKTSSASTELAIEHAIAKFDNVAESARRKHTRVDLERFVEMAAFAVNAGKALQEVAPVPLDLIKKHWLDPFAEANTIVSAEISSHLAMKDPKLTVRGVKQLRELFLPQGAIKSTCHCVPAVCQTCSVT